MLNASVGVQRVLVRLRRTESQEPTQATPLQQRSRMAARRSRLRLPRTRFTRPSLSMITLLARLGHERAVAIAVAGIVLGASVLSIVPGASASGATGGPDGDGPAPRVAVGGTVEDDSPIGEVGADYEDVTAAQDATQAYEPSATDREDLARGQVDAPDPEVATDSLEASTDTIGAPDDTLAGDPALDVVAGPFLADGTLLKPVAVDTSVADGSDLVRTYTVKSGDTLVEIARAHGVSMMTLWWANKLSDKDDLHRGQVLKIPPVSGLVLTVKAGDTLAAIAKEYGVSEAQILKTNGIADAQLVVGQILILPGAKGEPIATPEPTKRPARSSGSGGGSAGSTRPPKTYSGGSFRWPTTSRRVSQYFHYGHYGLDIDGSTGDPIWAAAGGTVTFAGWKRNGGGYQVWIAHGSGLYTTYNHMSSVSVGRGQHVAKGQRVGRMGSTGYSSGSHLHFEVWKGPIWSGGRRVNPLAYL